MQYSESEAMIADNTVNHRPGVIVRAANIVLGMFAGLSLGLFFLLVVRHGWTTHCLFLLALVGILAGSLMFPGTSGSTWRCSSVPSSFLVT